MVVRLLVNYKHFLSNVILIPPFFRQTGSLGLGGWSKSRRTQAGLIQLRLIFFLV